ncbi:MAG TPA: hypothetical protein PK306_14785 [Aquabacterium sp.]|nr:hypothetical protein [Aquabacterium sp.]
MKTLTALLALTLGLAGCAGIAPRTTAEPTLQRLVSEDDQVRIAELRVRGQTQSISVENKGSTVPGYQITPAAGGSDPSSAKGNAGQRVWTILSF